MEKRLLLHQLLAILLCKLQRIYGYVRFGDLFMHAPKRILSSPTMNVVRSKNIILPSSRPQLKIGEVIGFDLFDGQNAVGDVTHFVRRNDGSTAWAGNLRISTAQTLEKDLLLNDGYFSLSCVKSSCTAYLYIQSTMEEYSLDPAGTPLTADGVGMYTISQISVPPEKRTGVKSNTHTVLSDGLPNLLATSRFRGSHNSSSSSFAVTSAAIVDTDLIVDILVMYTNEALTAVGGSESAMESKVYLANFASNVILSNSAVSLRLRVVAIKKVSNAYVEPTPKSASTSFDSQLIYLTTPGDGYLDEAQVYREQYQADQVSLIIAASAYCGEAWVNYALKSDYAYAIYNVECMTGGSVYMHELGHTFGCQHDRISTQPFARNNPTYIGFGSCWEDASRSDCTCYKSVLVYECNTPQKHCTACSMKNHLANMYVIESGNPTGTQYASCGLLIHNNRYSPIAYRKSIQPGGIIYSVYPPFAIYSSCSVVNITGWQLVTNPSDVVSVTLSGYTATVISVSTNNVVVLSPRLPSSPSQSTSTGTVVVATSSGRTTTLQSAFTFQSPQSNYVELFSEGTLDGTLWQSTGTLPWSFTAKNGKNVLFRDGNLASSESAIAEITYIVSSGAMPSTGSCSEVVQSLRFSYWAYSKYPFCYNSFSVSTLSSSGVWSVRWAIEGSATSTNTWNDINIALSTYDVKSIRLELTTSINANCRSWVPTYIDNLAVYSQFSCNDQLACSRTKPPSITPTKKSTLVPTTGKTDYPIVRRQSLICQYGGFCKQNSDCVKGNKCIIFSTTSSQCVPDSSQYLTVAGCLQNNGGQCSATSVCCDPGAICSGSNNYKQCVTLSSPQCSLPDSYSSIISTTSASTRTPSALPSKTVLLQSTVSPTLPPTSNNVKSTSIPTKSSLSPSKTSITSVPPRGVVSATPTKTTSKSTVPSRSPSGTKKLLPICQYAGFCRINSDCLAGNKCSVFSSTSSQCVPDSTQYRNVAGCLTNYGGQCTGSSPLCCDPGAMCSGSADYKQCMQPQASSPWCRSPSSY